MHSESSKKYTEVHSVSFQLNFPLCKAYTLGVCVWTGAALCDVSET